jgi:cobalt-zinc-cadmium efflux system membrane fusion protein
LSTIPVQRRTLRGLGFAVGAAVVVAIALVAMRPGPPAPAAAPEERFTPWLEGGFIHFPAEFGRREKIAYSEAVEAELTPSLYVTGSVKWDARRVAALGARIQGRLRSVLKVEGEPVAAGEVVAELESVELGRAQAEVLKVRARETVARLDAERERKLADARVSAERDAQFALANAEALAAERVAAEKAVEALGGVVGGELGILKLKSPLAGRVVEVKARRGETVEPSDEVMVVADLSRVWVEFTVFERDLPAVREGDRVEIRLPGERTATLEGTVAHLSESLNPETRAGHVRVELENPGGRLRIGQSVTGTVHATGPRVRQLTVPRQAVTRIDGTPTVFVRVSDTSVEPRSIKVGAEDATSVAVLEGLKPGESVVTSGVLALKAEVFR